MGVVGEQKYPSPLDVSLQFSMSVSVSVPDPSALYGLSPPSNARFSLTRWESVGSVSRMLVF